MAVMLRGRWNKVVRKLAYSRSLYAKEIHTEIARKPHQSSSMVNATLSVRRNHTHTSMNTRKRNQRVSSLPTSHLTTLHLLPMAVHAINNSQSTPRTRAWSWWWWRGSVNITACALVVTIDWAACRAESWIVGLATIAANPFAFALAFVFARGVRFVETYHQP
jgi:hypothetical protein